MGRKISIVGVQTTPEQEPAANLKEALALTDEALHKYRHVDMLVLPEYFYEMVEQGEEGRIGEYPQEVMDAFSSRARAFETYIIAGAVLNRRKDGKLYNTALLFDRSGEVIGSYDKIHLFDVLNGSGAEQESNYCQRGDHLLVCDTDFGKIGVMICYDVRFPELARTLALEGARFLFVPAAFYSPRFDHWTDLIRATALQNSMVVAGVNLYGAWNPKNIFCGRSLISDPWGVKIAGASDQACYFQAYVEERYPDQIRDAVGSFHNRTPSMYNIPRE